MTTSTSRNDGQRAFTVPSATACEICGRHALSGRNPDPGYPHPGGDRWFCLFCGAHHVTGTSHPQP